MAIESDVPRQRTRPSGLNACNRWTWFFLALLARLIFSSTDALAGVGNFCPFGECNPANPIYLNVYWDSSQAQWDSDAGGPAGGMTEAQIDAFLAALVHSSYFSQLGQYGVVSQSSLPSITASGCGSPPANVDAAIGAMDQFVSCVTKANPNLFNPQVILNVFLPPQTINTGFCNQNSSGAHPSAMHDTPGPFQGWPAGPSYTFNPTTSACNANSAALLIGLSHEMVEAATDPSPSSMSGWKQPFGSEIGDLCQNLTSFPATSFLFTAVQQYWSNSANGCVVGFSNLTPPAVPSISICGAGPGMRIVLTGTFGAPPWDFSAGSSSQTLYLQSTISGQNNWTANNIDGSPPDTVDFGKIVWTQGTGPGGADQIQIFGFSAAYGTNQQIVSAGDRVTIAVENPANGAPASTSGNAPNPSQLAGPISVPFEMLVNGTGQVSGTVQDSTGCTVQGAAIALTASGGSFASPTVVTDASGSFSATFTAPSVAQPVTVGLLSPVSASSQILVHPVLNSLVQPEGAASGSEPTVLHGAGFDSTTQVNFGSNTASVQSVSADHGSVSLSTPPASNGAVGPVTVTAGANGVFATGLQYTYILPGVPFMQFLGGLNNGNNSYACNFGQIQVSAFNADGTLQSVPIALSASYPAFQLFPGRMVSSETVPSGSIVVVYGGGPVTAVNPQLSSNPTTQTFPILSQVQCAIIAGFPGSIDHIATWPSPIFHTFNPACTGDCGPGGIQTVFWGDSDNFANIRNFVAIQGNDPTAIASTYQVQSISIDAQRTLVSANPFVMFSPKEGNIASFLGPALQISKFEDTQKFSSIPESCQISFSLPKTYSSSETYAIVHLVPIGGTLGWQKDHPTSIDRRQGVVKTQADSTGTYALVRIFTQPEKPHHHHHRCWFLRWLGFDDDDDHG